MPLMLALAGAGCSNEEVNSDAIRTQGLFADMLALASGDGETLVRVDLTVGGDNGTTVNLVAPDELMASAGGPPGTLSRRGEGRYELRILGDSARDVSVELVRGPDDAGASAVVAMPEPFVMSMDVNDGIDRASPVTVRWEPTVAGGSVEWTVDGDCLWDESGVTPDDGSLTLDPEDFRVQGSDIGEECEALVTLTRESFGEVDVVLVPGSQFRAVQRRGVSFISTPAPDEIPGAEPPADAGL